MIKGTIDIGDEAEAMMYIRGLVEKIRNRVAVGDIAQPSSKSVNNMKASCVYAFSHRGRKQISGSYVEVESFLQRSIESGYVGKVGT